MKRTLLIIAIIFTATQLFSQKFKEVKGILPALQYSNVEFIDYDCDDDLDICVFGVYENNSQTSRDLVVYKNIGNDQVEKIKVDSLIQYGATISSIIGADINNDNIPEIVSIDDQTKLKFIQYNYPTFKRINNNDIKNALSYEDRGVRFADFDNDGADEILIGMDINDNYKHILNNVSFDSIYSEWSRWIDMNNDGKMDILRIHMQRYVENSTSNIYINNGANFDKNPFSYTEKPWTIEIGDYNNDGYEDVMIFSLKDMYAIQPTAELYRNNKNGNFEYIKDIAGATSGRFVDIDNDGDLDIVLLGHYEVWDNCFLKIFRNNGNDDFVGLPAEDIATDSFGDIRVGDYDNDGDNDILISSYGTKSIVGLFKNHLVEESASKTNKAPSLPQNLKEEVTFNHVRLSWNQSADAETPSPALTYNVFIKRSDGTFITSPNSNLQTGYKRLIGKGNAGFKCFYEINCLEDGIYSWSVQAIDNSNKGSLFATTGSFEIKGTKPANPSQLVAKTLSATKIHLEWEDNTTIEDGFNVEMYSDSIPNFRPAGYYECKTVSSNVTTCDIENLLPSTKYIFRVRAYNCSSSSASTNIDSAVTYPPPFTKKIILDNFYGREAEWGDFDRDGKLDILMFYTKGGAYGQSYTRILENNTDVFTELEVGLPTVEYFGSSRNGAVNWFDYNNDGLLDICLIKGEAFSAKIKIFKNNGDKTFKDIKCDSVLTIDMGSCGPSFADFDNDGDEDILLMGNNYKTYASEIIIYENLGNGKFVDSGIRNITGVIKSRMPWTDFNNDGYLDILANNRNSDGTSNIILYKNNGDKTFTKITFNHLQGLNNDYLNQTGDMSWGDYNNDGYADILISGAHTGSNGNGITKIYKNNSDETFTDTGIDNIYGVAQDVSIEWGDFNNDGILDILQTGDGWINGVAGKTRIFYNNNGTFEKEPGESFLEIHQQGMSTAADYDNDGDLDILDLGEVTYTHQQIALFDNFQPVKNTKPEAPSNLHIDYQNNEVVLKWDRANDIETSSKGLSYNIYLKNDSGTIIASAALNSGKRTKVAIGNAQHNNFLKVKNMPYGKYTWSVQSIDNCFDGSVFAPEHSFEYIKTGITDVNMPVTPLITLYPNPFTKVVNIFRLDSDYNKCVITISDLSGRIILNINDISLPYSIDTSSLKTGVYLVTITQGDSIFVKKIVKG